MSLFAALERHFARLLQSTPAPDNPWQAALDDLSAIDASLQRMAAVSPPYDGNERRGK